MIKSASGVTWLGEEPLTQDQMNNELTDLGVDVVSARSWQEATEKNTTGDALTKLPDAINPYDGLQVKGQGILGSCFAAALVGVAERQYFQKTRQVKRFAIMPTYMVGQMQTPGLYGKDGGTVPPHGIKAATKIGFMTVDTARKYLPKALIAKWKGDVYPRGHWTGQGRFEDASRQAYTEAARAYEPLLKDEKIREEMYQNRLQSIIPNRSTEDVQRSERAETATTLECHVWTPDCDSHQTRIETFSGNSRGGKHGHHATYIAGMSLLHELLKANSWREFALLMLAIQKGTEELNRKEWGDDGLKAWAMSAHRNMMRHEHTFSYACSNMSVTKATGRTVNLDNLSGLT